MITMFGLSLALLERTMNTFAHMSTIFLICSKDPERVMKEIESKYLVKDSSKGPLSYYLGKDYKKDKKGRWCIGYKTYLIEAIRRIEVLLGRPLPNKDTPMVDGDHPEEDQSESLRDEDRQ